MIGAVLMDRYRLEELIGEGGMASVYRALDLRTGHRVAVKFLRQEFQKNPEYLDRFRREATAASRMSHHNIVNLLDIGDDPKAPYLVFEFVDGKTLKEIITDHGRLPQATAVQIAIRILSALRHAHEAGIIHRDIKPQNILVDRQGYIKVSDFGIARMVGANTMQDAEGKPSVMGSVHYFSPEQAQGETATISSDLYSVGVVLYEMLTGTVPFEGETPVAIAIQHVQVAPKPIRELNPAVSQALENVVAKAMEKDPKQRYASAMFMAQALHAALLAEKEPTQDTPVFPAADKGKNRRRVSLKNKLCNRLLIILLSLTLIIGIGIGAVVIYRDIVNATRAPLVTGEMEESAIRLISQAGLTYKREYISSDEPVGMVITQSHDLGFSMRRGDTILITVSSGPIRKPVAKVTGLLQEEAREALERIGLRSMVTGTVMDPSPMGTVLEQHPEPDTEMNAGAIVQLVVSGGQVKVPDLSGLRQQDAGTLLNKEELSIGDIKTIEMNDPAQQGRVASQYPLKEELVMAGTAVDLVLYVLPEESPAPTKNGGAP
ncbi:MAG: protein kinase domain-containing protein [Christensenellales bacterium]|jgi:beta-lactam-binding protein with PASTA domain/tRNA A-37 threonylcarbamoyl transferase component Bud32